jgi:uncharacterized protein YfaS (alpha-2-macroglobulin family)
MRKLVSLILLAGALAVPAASAAPAKHGNPHGHGAKACHGKARVMVVLKGTLANDPAAGDASLQLTVLHTNRWGRGYKQASQPATVNVADVTRYSKDGESSTLDALTQNDRVLVQGKVSRCALREGDPANMPALTAKKVMARTPSA